MVVVDLSVLNVLGRGANATGIAKRLFPWVWVGLAVNLISGLIMFAADATDYLPTRSFQAKIVVVLLAIAFSIIVQFKIPTLDESPVLPASAKVLAIISILFWVGAILMGVEVPALSGIG